MSGESMKDLEATLKEKVNPLLEETMEKHWGITIPKLGSDITDQLKKPELNVYIPLQANFSNAKKAFKAEFIKKELRLHHGNVSQLAKFLGLDRRSIHRTIRDLAIDMGEVRAASLEREDYLQSLVGQKIRSTLEQYRRLLQPAQLEKLYGELPELSRSIAKFLPHPDWSWKDAEQEFERQFLRHALQESGWNVARAAGRIRLRAETLHRKIKKLGLREGK